MADALLVVTGASRGLGRELARTVPFPARIVDISRSGGDVEHLEADLADPAAWPTVERRLAAIVDEQEPERAVLVHAAGALQPIGFAQDVAGTAYNRTLLLNAVSGPVLGALFLAVTAAVARRDVVMLSSGAATSVYEGWSGYGPGKAALEHWVRTVGAEQARRGGARVVAVAPGVVATAMQQTIRATDARDFPAVDRFRDLHERSELQDAEATARRLWAALDGLDSGAVVDLRELGGAPGQPRS